MPNIKSPPPCHYYTFHRLTVISFSGCRSAACSSTSRQGNTNRTCFSASPPCSCPSRASRPLTAWWSSSSCVGALCAKRSDRQASALGRTAAGDQRAAETSRSNGCWVRALFLASLICAVIYLVIQRDSQHGMEPVSLGVSITVDIGELTQCFTLSPTPSSLYLLWFIIIQFV